MDNIYNLILSNIYLYICIIIVLLILTTILLIACANKRKRRQIKNDFVEAEKVEEELEKVKQAPENSELENLIKKMQEDMDVKPEDVVKKFEEEQEEKAIISYQELVDNVNNGKIQIEEEEDNNIDFVESLNPIEEEPVMALEETPNAEATVTPDMVKDVINSITTESVKEPPKQFKQSEFISPIYGRMENNIVYPTVKKQDNFLDIMNTKDYNKLSDEIKKQEEFLNALIEFRNNL